ncbi:aminoglycoside 6'-N-acetyltransferase [Paenibacillus sp. FSL M8-0334]|uniref:aminoglycoside 6'-N-acetyltransferase n=1 Tax=Paenibacillus sp. FSL M8-0334 TaxID=2921623 RepID=UPI0030FA3ED3
MLIVKASESELIALVSLALKLWPDNTMEHLRAEYEELLCSERDIFYLAVIGDKVVGFIHMSLRYDYVEGSKSSPVGYIEGIYVEEEYRNKGISRQLVEAGEQWSKSLGCVQVASDAELHNDGSQAFHKKIGYREVNRIVAFIKDI